VVNRRINMYEILFFPAERSPGSGGKNWMISVRSPFCRLYNENTTEYKIYL
jgi:hypothetical protein